MSELIRIGSGRRNSNGSLGIWRLAERQWGVVALWQMLDAGIGRATVARWVAAGRLHRIYPGVYALGHRKLTEQGWLAAALLYAGKGAALSHDTGAWWWEIVKRRPSRIDLSAPRNRSSVPGLNLHRPRNLERVFHRGLPITTPARTLLDIAPTCPRRQLRRALAETFYLRLATPADVRAVLKRGQPGSRALREALEAHVPQLGHTKSDLEDEFLALCERYGLPLPDVNSDACGYEVDAVWREQRVAVELDSESAHGAAGAVYRDRARDLALRRAGWTVLRYSWQQVFHEPEAVATDLARVICRRPR